MEIPVRDSVLSIPYLNEDISIEADPTSLKREIEAQSKVFTQMKEERLLRSKILS